MATLAERFYDRTIPEHGSSPTLTVMPRDRWAYQEIDDPSDRVATATIAFDFGRLAEAFRAAGEALGKILAAGTKTRGEMEREYVERQAEFHADIMRACAGMRRRQMRRRR